MQDIPKFFDVFLRYIKNMSYLYAKFKTMPQSKVELFDEDLQEYATFFKALSHPARLRIISYLAECKSCISGDISNELPLGRTTVNQHLDELKKLGLIDGEVSGVKVYYCLNFEKMKEMIQSCHRFINGIDIENCCT